MANDSIKMINKVNGIVYNLQWQFDLLNIQNQTERPPHLDHLWHLYFQYQDHMNEVQDQRTEKSVSL